MNKRAIRLWAELGRVKFTYPSLSEKSRVLKRAGATLLAERHLKMDSLPLRQAIRKVSCLCERASAYL